MNIIINENLKHLRKQKGKTQEEFAEHLGISYQAVSKWERGEGYPDITLLPSITAYYNVTVDELLGVGEIRIREKIAEYNKESAKLLNIGDHEANLLLWRKASTEFPNDMEVLNALMSALFHECKNNTDEILDVGDKILSTSTDDRIRYNVIQLLCFTYHTIGDNTKAVAYANMMPKYWQTVDQTMDMILDGEELVKHVQNNLETLVGLLCFNIRRMVLFNNTLSCEYKKHACKFGVQVLEALYENGDFGFAHEDMLLLHQDMAELYAKESNVKEIILILNNVVKHAVAFDTQQNAKHTSPLVDKLLFKRTEVIPMSKGNACRETLSFLASDIFNFCREDNKFITIITGLQKYAN